MDVAKSEQQDDRAPLYLLALRCMLEQKRRRTLSLLVQRHQWSPSHHNAPCQALWET
jgi:hypothetical protein